MKQHNLPRSASGDLAEIAWPGGYMIAYYCSDGTRLCYECALEHEHDDLNERRTTSANTHWEGPSERCVCCNVVCES